MIDWQPITDFFALYKPVFLLVHILGTVIGLGGATISDMLFFSFLKDYRISKKEAEVLHLLKNLIMTALVFILASGAALYLTDPARYNQSAPFVFKVLVVLVVSANGVLLHAVIAPHLIHLNLNGMEKMGVRWHRLAFALGAVSFTSWYTVFCTAILKAYMPWSLSTLLIMYVVFLVCAITGSQIMERVLTHRASSH